MSLTTDQGIIHGYYPPEAEELIIESLRRSRRQRVYINISERCLPDGSTPIRGKRGALLGTIPWQYTGIGWRRG